MRLRPRTITLALASGLLLSAAAGAQERQRLVGRPVQEYRDAVPALLMPTAVAVSDKGEVYVVDGVNDRMVEFAPGGEFVREIRTVGAETLQTPVGARLDADGRLWIADTGHHRVLVRNPDGTLARMITLPADYTPAAPDITDFAFSPDGRSAWLVDNDHHQLVRYDLAGGAFTIVGQFGESLGQFHYPYSIAAAATGELIVSDVLNGRVQVLDATGRPSGSAAGFGVELGQVYRPKGVALDAGGNVWVADGTLGVVQVFTLDGRLVDVLRDESGRPYRFELPMGLTFDARGDLYVVELRANRVSRLQITSDPNAPPPERPQRRAAAGSAQQARSCAICHLEWTSPLVEGKPTALLDVPANPADYPLVSRGETCLTCHDGSVGDARRRVWIEHGHRTGMVPPPTMTVPKHLPLADGRIACRTCHSAHGPSSRAAAPQTVVFLRVEGSPSNLCNQCHTNLGGGPAAGMHPLGHMDLALPAELAHRGATAGSSEIACLTCHTGHGARHDHLLALDPDQNVLCLACHRDLAPDLFGDETRSRHGRQPQLTAEQQAAAQQFATRTSAAGELLCLTCHQPHQARHPEKLLAFDPAAQDACAACHGPQRPVIGSSHDLRTNHPEAANVLGVTPEAGGACSGCHTAHRSARPARVTADDPVGKCVNCHSAGELAATKLLGAVNHPGARCTACHNPHEPGFGSYVKGQPAQQCLECHPQNGVPPGPHNIATVSATWPQASVTTHDDCLACHRPHGTLDSGLFRAGQATGIPGPDAACLACHAGATPQSDSPIALVHPRDPQKRPVANELPLSPLGEHGQVACRTCHNPHGGGGSSGLLRIATAANTQQLCVTCHSDMANIHTIGHALEPLKDAGFKADGCKPCHVTHANPQGVEPRYLWPRELRAPADALANVRESDHYCVSCHRTGGPVAPPAIATHPKVEMFNPIDPQSAGYLPLYNDRGEIDAQGNHACRTCHLTHGRRDPAPLPADLKDVGQREVRARQWHIRSFVPGNVCTTCHGFDALRRFIYFHDATRRGGPIQ